VADIHFTPAAAMKAVEHVDKIRINPGNYADKKKFAVKEYTDAEYAAELERIERVFSPLVLRARELGVSMRIGTNHGSLSDRIMNRYGDTPEGMVEFYRLLAERMAAQGMDYPFHVGVTEAGDGEDGRIKSAIGIGALLDEGIGDTIRVSLTEDPVREIPVATALAERYNRRRAPVARATDEEPIALREPVEESRDPFGYERRASGEVRIGPHTVGGARPVRVEVPLSGSLDDERALQAELDSQAGVRVPEETRADLVVVELDPAAQLPALTRLRSSVELVAPGVALTARVRPDRLLEANDEQLDAWLAAAHRFQLSCSGPPDDRAWRRLLTRARATSTAILVEATSSAGDMEGAVDCALSIAGLADGDLREALLLALAPARQVSPLHAYRLLAARLAVAGRDTPLVLLDRAHDREADPLLGTSAAVGGLLCDGIGDAVQIAGVTAEESRRLAFGILQAARVRITRTEFISCPSCGRTLFDLEETTARIKARTAHLKGLKIAVMGCIVNGPGEMADADFGYVGWGEDKIALFVGKEMVARDIPTAEADEQLVQLIKEHGRWVDPPVPAEKPI
jgi:(E)-4-hydroxy-3-methylbut-2-enyl-diphosphate synthase